MSTTAKSNAKSTTRRKPVQSAQERPAAQVVQFPLFAPKPRQTAPQEVQVVICECSTDAVRVRLLPDPAAVWCMMDETFGTLGWTRRYYFADGRLWCGVGVYHPLMNNFATQFAAATGLTVMDVGVVNDANPTSSDAILAQSQTLVLMAQQLNTGNGDALHTIACMAQAIARNVSLTELTEDERGVMAHFKNPAMPSVAVTADAAIKIATARQEFASTDTFLEMIGFDQADIRRIRAQEQRARGQALLMEMDDADNDTDVE